jgi:CRP-like cAMP-binding protein
MTPFPNTGLSIRTHTVLGASAIIIRKKGPSLAVYGNSRFEPSAFLASTGLGRRIVRLKTKQTFFVQGSHADCVYYLQSGRAKLTVVSKSGKEATITLLVAGEFIGEEAIAGAVGLRLATATAITSCVALKIEREEMLRVLHEEHAFSDLFLKFLLHRSMRTQADLVDQLFNSSEKRLARILLLMAEFGKPGDPETLIPRITQETLAEMIGTTRSRVSFFMNRFRKLGFIEYKGRIRVHKSLLNVILHDQLPEHNATKPAVEDPSLLVSSPVVQHERSKARSKAAARKLKPLTL